MQWKRVPKHIGIIPDGNRRWAVQENMEKQDGYAHGVDPGVVLYRMMLEAGVKEATFYGFTKDNTSRPQTQIDAFCKACAQAVEAVALQGANILVVGDTADPFPKELLQYTGKRSSNVKNHMNVNFLVNYDWEWDLSQSAKKDAPGENFSRCVGSREISRMDLIIRWGGKMRLSGFLPVQSVYSDFYVVEDYWPDFKEEHFLQAMSWYQDCDVTLGG